MNTTLEKLMSWGETVLDLVLPPCCAGCGTLLLSGPLCDLCVDHVKVIESPRCPVCGIPFDGAGPDHPCGRCIESMPGFSSTTATFRYAGPIADGVIALKYGRRLERLGPLADLWREECRSLPEVDVAVPVPLHPTRLRQRGFNQSALIARPLLRKHGIRLRCDVLRRVRAGDAQAGLGRADRLRNPRGTYDITPRGSHVLEGRRVLVLDDIMTTGATMRECARVLLDAGAAEVHVAVLARSSVGS
jgi:ComF family protein